MVGGKLVPAEEPLHLKAKSDNKYFGEEARTNFFKLYQKVRFGVEHNFKCGVKAIGRCPSTL